ncbi:magnesium transporter MgtE N-terminal domain-containing protein [Paenibacillus sp. J2TS4]|uniref:magnesium transporter MgtE N-terminal domain-containing protein n=1 Tax=Paenibacillus sp. J2TS4 TaxID=2807194 RepID=UPI001B02DC7A|nr:hypothetical protein [Paenibacillus sp. J2TS4]GIP33069.1 hypothetical protein J2TS4_22790 [Paenibacillus sp. J2TS4]
MDTELEKTELSAFERLFYWVLIPILFTGILVLVYLFVFDNEFKQKIHSTATSIPVIGGWFGSAETEESAPDDPAHPAAAQEEQIKALKQQLSEKDEQLTQATSAEAEKDRQIEELQTALAALDEQLEEQLAGDEEYAKQIRQTGSMYAKMTPSKAAAIMENLTNQERVLFLNEMKSEERTRILEKMNPQLAAETSVALKDAVLAKDTQIAALQERIKAAEEKLAQAGPKLSSSDVGSTFANMDGKQAAALLLEMNATSPDKVVEILNATSNEARSRIMSEMSKENSKLAAAILAKLVP